jgi:hypothetical protein
MNSGDCAAISSGRTCYRALLAWSALPEPLKRVDNARPPLHAVARFEAIADPSIPQRGRAGADATVLDQRPRPEIADSQTAVPTAEVLYCHLRRADLLRHLQNVVPGMAGPDIGHAGIRCGEACPSECKIAVVGEPRRRRVTEADFAAGAIAWPADRGHRFFTVERRLIGEIDYVSRNRLLPVPRLPNRRHGGMRYKRALRTRR